MAFWRRAPALLGKGRARLGQNLPHSPAKSLRAHGKTRRTSVFPMASLVYFPVHSRAITLILLPVASSGAEYSGPGGFCALWLVFCYTVGASVFGGLAVFCFTGGIDYSGVIDFTYLLGSPVHRCLLGRARLNSDRERFPKQCVAIAGGRGALCHYLLVGPPSDVVYFKKPFRDWSRFKEDNGLVALLQGQVDDTLGVFHTHAVAGLLGGLLTGLLAEPVLSDLILVVPNSRGAFYGGSGGIQFLKQLVAALFVIGWNVISTTAILLAIRLFMPLRMPEEELAIGDDAVHGEEAYAL
ncbi:hypothetical protein Acr_11g0000860 [Actinidia rufa]|uniref:Ammonium transporter AmtB-like domain-containing protein n=1 Tax=Actinidia rufa TaxID=165716 RepID=A0A7J0FAQ3_9ERIC|nr:hypothetical protein Acr_11g0000860 [Actinidia rufa]